MRPHRVADLPLASPVELAKQESLDELRTTVQLAASSMECSTKDIKLLGEKMAAATERMSDTVQDNSQALVLLTQVVERLQSVLTATRAEINPPNPAVHEQHGTPRRTPKSGEQPHQSRCSSSSSLSSSQDTAFTSQGTGCLSATCRGSPRTTVKTTKAPLPQKKHVQESVNLLTNGVRDEPRETSPALKGPNQQKRRRRRKAT